MESTIADREKIGSPTRTSPEPHKAHVIIRLNQRDYGRISKEMVELWEKGCSLNDIARLIGKSKARVRSALHRNGIATQQQVDEAKVTAWRKRRKTSAHPPFGYVYFLGQLVIEPREQEILLLIERLAKEGMNPNAIAKHLNELHLHPRRANRWSRNSVVLLLNRRKE